MSTEREQRFIERIMVHGNATKAAIEAGYSKNGADAQGSRLKKKLAPLIHQALITEFSADAPEMRKILMNLARNANSEEIRLRATRDLLDRAGYKAPDKKHVTHEHRQPREQLANLMRIIDRLPRSIQDEISMKINPATSTERTTIDITNVTDIPE